jgi:hypothetical protein
MYRVAQKERMFFFLNNCNFIFNVPLLHGYWTDPSALFSGGVGRSPTITLPTTTHFKNIQKPAFILIPISKTCVLYAPPCTFHNVRTHYMHHAHVLSIGRKIVNRNRNMLRTMYRVTQKKRKLLKNPNMQNIFMAAARCWPSHWSMITKWRGFLELKVHAPQCCQLYIAANTHFKSYGFFGSPCIKPLTPNDL